MINRLTDSDFARLLGLRASKLAWFIGAGCSAAAGIPTAQTMIMEFKAGLFCAATKLPRQEIDPGDPLWATRINDFFNGQRGFPAAGDPDEYAVAFEAAYPNANDRRAYIDQAVRRGVPSFGHRVFAALISTGRVPCIFTTNFDPLIERATVITDELQPAHEQAHLTVAALDSAERAERCLRDSTWPLLAKLHGDYQSDQLKNVLVELLEQDARLRHVLMESCRRFGLVVVGYSGRDSSVMDALGDAIAPSALPGGLFWVARPGSALLTRVTELLNAAEAVGIETHVVEAANFDELAGEIERQADLPPALAQHVRAARPAPRVVPVTLSTIEGAMFPVLRCSALPIVTLPTEARRLTVSTPLTTMEARAALKQAGVRGAVAALGREAAAFGLDSELLAAFASHGAELAGIMDLDPGADSWALGLLYEGLARALSRGRPLRPRLRARGHFLVVANPDSERNDELAVKDRETLRLLAKAYGGPITGTVPALGLPFAYTRAAFLPYTPVVRVATVGPASGRTQVNELLGSLRTVHQPQDRAEYVPPFPGFRKLFGADLELAKNSGLHVAWPDRLEDFRFEGTSEARIGAALDEVLRRLETLRDEFDVLTVHLPDRWLPSSKTLEFDAHDSLKVLAALAGIPTQVLNDRTFNFPYRTSVAWRLSIALYVKAGGVPWKLVPVSGVPSDSAYIGLAYALRGEPRNARFVTCCSQVFDADGGGMQFVAYEARDPLDQGDAARSNPYLSRSDMRAVMTRSLLLYQARNGGAVPRRLVVHKQTPFRDEELAGVEDALAGVEEVECIEITSDVSWRGVWLQASRQADRPSEPDLYPVHRGVMVPTSQASALLWVAGNAPAVSRGGAFYQGGKSIPRPLLLTRHAGRGPLEVAAAEALALTKMDWNNDALYDPVPVTILYARRLSRIVANVASLPSRAYPYRLFM
ncbi:MAG: SIR2 family protein [Candidatus Dormibacteraeota bacterium]|nr:SIR2 family protein [Candidatus Dormibacteraeota bacterium]